MTQHTNRTGTMDRRTLLHGAVGVVGAATLAGAAPPFGSPSAHARQSVVATGNPNTLRTPERNFEDVADFPYSPRYTTVSVGQEGTGPVRIASYSAGPRGGAPLLLMHGNPTWSYLYRFMIPAFARRGFRVTAVDLYGFGRSDKPASADIYTYRAVEEAMTRWFLAQRISDVNLLVQDWGGLIGLRLFARLQARFRRLVTFNTALPSGAPDEPAPSPTFLQFEQAAQDPALLPAPSFAIQPGSTRTIPAAQLAAYDAPMPTPDLQTAFRILPSRVPLDPSQPGAARNAYIQDLLARSGRPWLVTQGADDDITGGWEGFFQGLAANPATPKPVIIPNAAHFGQEDEGFQLAVLASKFFAGKI